MVMFIKDPHILHNVDGVPISDKTIYDQQFQTKNVSKHARKIDEMARSRFYRKTK